MYYVLIWKPDKKPPAFHKVSTVDELKATLSQAYADSLTTPLDRLQTRVYVFDGFWLPMEGDAVRSIKLPGGDVVEFGTPAPKNESGDDDFILASPAHR